MVGVIIVDLGTVVFSLVLKAAPGTVEVAEPLLHGAAGKAQHIGSGCGGQRVADIVLTADLHLLVFGVHGGHAGLTVWMFLKNLFRAY